MNVVYAMQSPPATIKKSIFLAGPSPRNDGQYNWRPEAIELLSELGFDDTIFVPLPADGKWPESYDEQVNWETRYLNMADAIVFWVPRDLKTLPAFTTNVEFGMWFDSGKAVLGFPPEAAKMRYLEHDMGEQEQPVYHTLRETLAAAVEYLGDGATRSSGEREVPLYIWKTSQFQEWYAVQQAAGNRLDGARVCWNFRVGNNRRLFFWALHINMYIAAEGRNKTNEVIISRPNVSMVVAFCRGESLMSTQVILVREFRAPAATADGYVLELPGGSTWEKEEDETATAQHEFVDETGLSLEPRKLHLIGQRQLAATMSTHKASVFAYELSEEELKKLQHEMSRTHGVAADTELTHLEMKTMEEILSGEQVDWSNVGMILKAVIG